MGFLLFCTFATCRARTVTHFVTFVVEVRWTSVLLARTRPSSLGISESGRLLLLTRTDAMIRVYDDAALEVIYRLSNPTDWLGSAVYGEIRSGQLTAPFNYPAADKDSAIR